MRQGPLATAHVIRIKTPSLTEAIPSLLREALVDNRLRSGHEVVEAFGLVRVVAADCRPRVNEDELARMRNIDKRSLRCPSLLTERNTEAVFENVLYGLRLARQEVPAFRVRAVLFCIFEKPLG